MNFKNILRVSIEDIMCKKSRFLLSALLTGISLYLIGYFQVFSSKTNAIRRECEDTLTMGIDGTGILRITRDYATYEAEELKRVALETGMVKGIGVWNFWVVEMLPELAQIQQGFPDVLSDASGGSKKLFHCTIDRSAIDIYNFRFSDYENVEEYKWKTSTWHGIFLGANFKSIPVGTVFREEQADGQTHEYEVIGVLEKGQRMVSDEVMCFGRGNGVFSLLQMDSLVVIVMEQGVSQIDKNSAWAYIPGEGVSLEEARDFLKEKVKELDIRVEFGYLGDGFYADSIMRHDYDGVEEEIKNTLFWVCLLINCCIVIMMVMGEKKNIGIRYAFGFSQKDILVSYLSQTILRVMIPLAFSIWILNIFCRKRFSEYQPFEVCTFRWLREYAYPTMIAFSVIMTVVYALMPLLLIHFFRPAEMIKDSRG